MAFPLFSPPRARTGQLAPATEGQGASRAREVAALLLWTGGIFLTCALGTYRLDEAHASVGTNWVGPVGEVLAQGLTWLLGLAAWAAPIELFLLGIPLVFGRQRRGPRAVDIAGDASLALLVATLVQVAHPKGTAFGSAPIAGTLGELFGEISRSLFSTIGSYIVGFALVGLILIARAAFSFVASVKYLSEFGAKGALGTAKGAKYVADAWKQAGALERDKVIADKQAAEPHIAEPGSGEATIAVMPEEDPAIGDAAVDEVPVPVEDEVEKGLARVGEQVAEVRRGKGRKRGATKLEDAREAAEAVRMIAERCDLDAASGEQEACEPEVDEDLASITPTAAIADDSQMAKGAEPEAGEVPAAKSKRARKAKGGPAIIDTSAALAVELPKEEPLSTGRRAAFTFPSIDLLVALKVDPTLSVDRETLLRNADLLVKTLADYGVSGKVEDILPGPTVTTYEVSPAPGTKVSKVASLADDLALALARKVRIVAPIPGKNRIGFELPNERRVPVNLRDLIEDRRFQTLDVPLPVVLGRDILGSPVYADLASMPHVIVAGATGAGKSVGLNVMLTSLLYRKSPEELRLLMIDPKVVELAPFDTIPHMLLPVVTDMKQAANALKWAVDEMERRYQLFADAGTKNIGTFNAWADKVRRGEVKNPLGRKILAKDHNGFVDEIAAKEGEGEQEFPEKLPMIVIVVDEFADLMMQQGKDVEAAVARLAQKARAAGMHVIVATQRPSVDVITGMIKANFPTRIAFRVAQKVDSRTILDEMGAEHLLGKGDMLIKLNGTNDMKRVQCPMVSEEEVQAVTAHLRTQGEPVYDDNIVKPRDDDEDLDEQDAEQDSVYDDAVRIVAETRRCSTSWLQRKLGLGYNRAARIVEMMERRGIVGPANGAKDREVLVQGY